MPQLNLEALNRKLADLVIADKLTNAGLVVNGGSPEAMTNTVKKQDVRTSQRW